jgi:hypothetical protein
MLKPLIPTAARLLRYTQNERISGISPRKGGRLTGADRRRQRNIQYRVTGLSLLKIFSNSIRRVKSAFNVDLLDVVRLFR